MAAAQTPFWQPTTGPGGGAVRALARQSADTILAATEDGGVFRSANNGQTWADFSTGLGSLRCFSLGSGTGRNEWLVGTTNGIFRYDRAAAAWVATTGTVGRTIITHQRLRSGVLLAGSLGSGGGGTLRSIDNGRTWTPVAGLGTASVWGLAAAGDSVWAVNYGQGVSFSTNGGQTYAARGTGPANRNLWGLLRRGGTGAATELLANTNGGGVFRSPDAGLTWQRFSRGLAAGDSTVTALRLGPGGTVYAATRLGLYVLPAGATAWTARPTAPGVASIPYWDVLADAMGGGVTMGSLGAGVVRSTDGGLTWNYSNTGLAASQVRGLVASGGYLFAAHHSTVSRTNDRGQTWSPAGQGLPNDGFFVNGLAADAAGTLYAGSPSPVSGGLYRSTDQGQSWTLTSFLPVAPTFRSLAVAPNGTVLAGVIGRLLISTDQGATFRAVVLAPSTPPNPDPAPNTPTAIGINSRTGTILLGTGSGAVWRSTDQGLTFQQLGSSFPTGANAESIIFPDPAGSEVLLAGGNYVFYSPDEGSTVSTRNLPASSNGAGVRALLSPTPAGPLYAATTNGVWRSPDLGQTWAPTGGGLKQPDVAALAADNGYLYAGTRGTGVFRSTQQVLAARTAAWSVAGLDLYPNPATDQVELRLALADRGPVALVDALGREVRRWPAGTATLPLAGLAPGLYVVRVAGPRRVRTARLAVE